jgi:hypothetical protein
MAGVFGHLAALEWVCSEDGGARVDLGRAVAREKFYSTTRLTTKYKGLNDGGNKKITFLRARIIV